MDDKEHTYTDFPPRDDEMERCQRKRLTFWLGAILGIFLAAAVVIAHAQGLDKPAFVVSTEKLDGSPSARTVMLVTPIRGGHVGVMLNKPSAVKMIDLFPEHPPSVHVQDSLYLGGPVNVEMVVMLARFDARPAIRAVEMLPGIWLVFDAGVIDHVIETRPNEARYFIGMVSWRPGGLAAMVDSGRLAVKPADASKVFSDPATLYNQLVPAGGKGQDI